ncbi:RNA polymerase Rpb4 family protein [[Eubacterium] cellulosolvens]
MPKKVLKEEQLTTPETKEILDKIDEESLGEFQRRVLDFSTKFSKMSGKDSRKLMKKLIADLELSEIEAIQIINAMPESPEEVRSILAVKGRTFQTGFFEEILKLLAKFRK